MKQYEILDVQGGELCGNDEILILGEKIATVIVALDPDESVQHFMYEDLTGARYVTTTDDSDFYAVRRAV